MSTGNILLLTHGGCKVSANGKASLPYPRSQTLRSPDAVAQHKAKKPRKTDTQQCLKTRYKLDPGRPWFQPSRVHRCERSQPENCQIYQIASRYTHNCLWCFLYPHDSLRGPVYSHERGKDNNHRHHRPPRTFAVTTYQLDYPVKQPLEEVSREKPPHPRVIGKELVREVVV
jgi:hypothetical protein